MNQSINKSFEDIMKSGFNSLTVNDFKRLSQNAIVIDCRKPQDFAKAHIPGAIFIGIDGGFAPWQGQLLKT